MLVEPSSLLAEFSAAAGIEGLEGWPCHIRTEVVAAPHRPPPLLPGHGAIYVFALAEHYGSTVPAGSGAVLKVGLVGPNSGPVFSINTMDFPLDLR
jgi:hypothetical protein